MNIVPYILNFETKNLIISQIVDTLKNTVIKFTESLLLNFSSSRYISNILNLQKELNAIIQKLIISFIHSIDNNYRISNTRKEKYYINKQNVSRTIYTIFGEITFYRTLYKSKIDDKYYIFIDDALGIESYKLYDPIVRAISINDSVNNNPNNASYHSSLNSLNILGYIANNKVSIISRQSIYRWIREFNLKEIRYNPINNNSTLYVMADEKWIHKQDKNDKNKKKWIMSKCFVVFTSIKRKGKRSELVGKHIFITTTSSPYKELMDEICKIYNFEKIQTINLLSDAGNWILAGKDELVLYSHNKVVVNTCEFHVKQKINRSTVDKDYRDKLTKAIYDDEDKEMFIKLMDEIIGNKEKQSRKDKVTEYKNYILKHWKGIISMKYSDIKSSMESHISHYIASKFGSRPKAYSNHYIQNYLKLQESYVNQINILDYYLKCIYSNDDFEYNEKEVDFSIFDYSTSNLPICSSSSPISKLLSNIAYPSPAF